MARIEILNVGHALVQGARGAAGGAPSKDSIWGLAIVNNTLVKFSGRRDGKLSFQTEKMAGLEAAQAQFQRKVDGKDGKDFAYNDVTGNSEFLASENLVERVSKGFYAATFAKQLNIHTKAAAARKAAKAA